MLFSTKLRYIFSGDSQNCPNSVFYWIGEVEVGRGGERWRNYLNQIEFFEKLYLSEFFVIEFIIIVL